MHKPIWLVRLDCCHKAWIIVRTLVLAMKTIHLKTSQLDLTNRLSFS
jgi:hypothetical protein